MNLPDIKEVRLLIRRPNPDDVDDDLAEVIERRLRQQKADQYEESLKVSGKQSIKPNSRTKKLAAVAAENGDVAVKSLVNGVMVTHHATSTPLKEVEKYPSDEATQPRFIALAHKVFSIIGSSRRQTRA
jgi:hypothetical protein